MTESPVDIGKLVINEIQIDSGHFRAIYSGGDGYIKEIGKMLFMVNVSLTVHEDSCPLANEGCQCGRSPHQAKLICSMPGVQCPESTECSSPLKPKDHCCYDVCGAIIHLKKPWDFSNLPINMDEVRDPCSAQEMYQIAS